MQYKLKTNSLRIFAEAVVFFFFEGGDREWLFIYPRPIISIKCVQSVSYL